MTHRGNVVIVDAYSSGSLYAPELVRRGYRSIHVQSTDPIPPDDLPAFVPSDHAANIVFDGDFERLVRSVRGHAPLAVITGCEQAVTLTDRLSEALALATSNGTALTATRRNKVAMQRRIAELGIPSIPTQVASEWATVEPWVSSHLPVVLKPPSSGGTDQVFICTTTQQARDAFHAIIGRPNTFGEMNHEVVVQTLVEGIEYNVDHVSYEGKRFCVEMWRVPRLRVDGDEERGRHPIYDRGVMIPRHGEHQEPMVAYVERVLDAIGIQYGPSHAELMWTDTGPVLLEVAARLHGQKLQLSSELVTGLNQAYVALDSYLEPARFLARVGTSYEMPREFHRIELICHRSGVLRGYPLVDQAKALRSFHKLELFVEPGNPIAKTTDLMTVPGFIDLIHADPEVIEQDHQQIRAWELANFYDVGNA